MPASTQPVAFARAIHRPGRFAASAKAGRPALGLIWLIVFQAMAPGAVGSEAMPIVSKWDRFEQSWRSSVVYANPPRQATLTFLFVSPLGETNVVAAFWDGGQTWRVRFSPNQPGRWSYRSFCSDGFNQGLHGRSGAFLCTAATGHDRFTQHGPVRLARDRRHFAHEDGTPFLWLTDSTRDGARISDPDSWQTYARIRATQRFTGIQWAVGPGADANNQSAFTGRDRIRLNPEFFQRLDAKIEILNRAGLLSVITLFRAADRQAAGALTQEQLTLLARYTAARWSAYNVAWLWFVEGNEAPDVECCQRAGRSAYNVTAHAPVIVVPLDRSFSPFRDEKWVDAFGFVGDRNEALLAKLLTGPLAAEWRREPARPLIDVEIARENRLRSDQTRVTAQDVRRALWWSLLLAPPAGAGYSADRVISWDRSRESAPEGKPGGNLPAWQQALFLPGARQMAAAAAILDSFEFWRLRPVPRAVAPGADDSGSRAGIAAAATDANDPGLVYVPDGGVLRLFRDRLPPLPVVDWINPQSGEQTAAVALVEGRICQFAAPGPGDWLLRFGPEK